MKVFINKLQIVSVCVFGLSRLLSFLSTPYLRTVKAPKSVLHIPGMSISGVNGFLLNGSVCAVNKCLVIVERSRVMSLVGNLTGSVINMLSRGSRR